MSAPQRFGPWEVLGELARGGQGAVLRARDPAAGDLVALKLLLRVDGKNERRFRQEAHVLERLAHPGIVRFRGHGVEQGVPWLAMELVAGESLSARVARDGPLEPAAAARLVADLARAVHHVHALGVLHRDLKPDNVLVRPDGRPVLVDFGILRRDAEVFGELSIDAHSRLSRTGELRGTPSYMAPEQVAPGKFGKPDARTDVYGLGGILFHALTGAPPRTAASFPNLIVQILEGDAPDPAALRPGLPPALVAACRGALARAPADRPPSADALADQLLATAGVVGSGAPRAGAPARPARAALAAGVVVAGAIGLAVAGGVARERSGGAATPGAEGPAGGGAAVPGVAEAGPAAALERADALLLRDDPIGALAALEGLAGPESAGGRLEPPLRRRRAALEAEARWLLGDLDGAARATGEAGPEGEVARALVDAARGSAGRAREALGRAPPRPSTRLALALAGVRAGPADRRGGSTPGTLAPGTLAPEALAAALALGRLTPPGAHARDDDGAPGAPAPGAPAPGAPAPGAGAPGDPEAPAAAAARERLVRRTLELAAAEPELARALVAARAAGEATGGLLARARARAASRAAEAVAAAPGAGPAEVLVAYRAALVPWRWVLALAPDDPPPEALVALAGALRPLPRADEDELTWREAREAVTQQYFRGGRDAAAGARVLAHLETLWARAGTRAARRGVAHPACDMLVDQGMRRNAEATAWSDEFVEGATHEDHDVLVQRAHALQLEKRPAEALTLLDAILEDDPLHGDARERRAAVRLDAGDFDGARRDALLALHDRGRSHFSTMRSPRDPYFMLSLIERRRGDLPAAIAALEQSLAWGGPRPDTMRRLKAELEAELAAKRR